VGLLHAAARAPRPPVRRESDEHCHKREEQRMGNVQSTPVGAAATRRETINPRPALATCGDDFLDGQPGDFHGGEQAVFDFARD